MRRNVWSRQSFVVACVLAVGLTFAIEALSVGAGAGDTATAFVPISPCRLADTRAGGDNVGVRATPIGPAQSINVQATGPSGNCNVPASAVGVALNVTVLNGTSASFLTVFPADVARPLASNLNWVARQPPTPNKVDVKLSAQGAIALYNSSGTVDVIADIVGYYASGSVVDLLARVQALERRQPFAVGAGGDAGVALFGDGAIVKSVTLVTTAAGTVVVNSTVTAQEATSADWVTCSITTGLALDDGYVQFWQSGGPDAEFAQLAGTRIFSVAADQTVTFNLFCRRSGPSNASAVLDPTMTAIFTPDVT